MFRSTVLAAAFVLALPLAAAAQTAPSAPVTPVGPAGTSAPAAGAPRPHHGLRAMLANLNLTDAQRSQIKAIGKKYHDLNQGVTDRAARRANHQQQLQEIMGVLTPAQQTELKSRIAAARHRAAANPPATPAQPN